MSFKSTLLATTAVAVSLSFAPSAGVLAQDSEELEEVVVIGSYIKRQAQIDTASPISVLGGEDINAIGAKTIADITQTLTINTGAQNNPDAFTQNFSTGTSNMNLRGLGVSSTLVLLNGKRQVVSGAPTDAGLLFVDTSSLIPMIAIEQVEILKDGAAALYGTDAVAGVVNFKTRNNFEGFEMSADMQSSTEVDQDDYRIQAIAGAGNDKTSVMAAFSYFDRSAMTTAEKRLPGSLDPVLGDFSNAGMPGTFLTPTLPVGLPAALQGAWTAVLDSAGAVPGLADYFEGVPGATLPAISDLYCSAGENSVVPSTFPFGLCRLDFGTFFNLVPEESRYQGYASFSHEVSDAAEIYGEFGYARTRASRGNTPSFPITTPLGISADQPHNYFGADVLMIGRPVGQGNPSNSSHASDTLRAQIGVRGDVLDGWNYDFSYTRAINDYELQAKDTLVDRFNNALVGLGGAGCDTLNGLPGQGACQFFNPFGSSLTAGAPGFPTHMDWDTTDAAGDPVTVSLPVFNNQGLIDHFFVPLVANVKSRMTAVDFVMAGDLFDMGDNTVGAAFGAQYRREHFGADYNDHANNDNFLFLVGNPDYSQTRNVKAIFGEVAIPFGDYMEVQGAIRYTDYGGVVGDSLDPKIALLSRLSDDIVLRASYSTSFRAPSAYQQNGTQTSLQQLSDKLAGQSSGGQFRAVRTVGNPNLKPEQSNTITAGMTWRVTEQIEVNADYWFFDFSNVIIQENAQAIINADPSDTRIDRTATGALLQVNSGYANAASLKTSGLDVGINTTLHSDADSSLVMGVEGTYIINYDLIDPQAGAVSGVGNRNFTNFGTSTPQLRINGHLGYNFGRHTVNMFARYIDGYDNDQSAGTTVGSFTSLDAQYSLEMPAEMVAGMVFTLGVINALDTDPPMIATNGGYDSKIHDPRGRMIYARVSQRF